MIQLNPCAKFIMAIMAASLLLMSASVSAQQEAPAQPSAPQTMSADSAMPMEQQNQNTMTAMEKMAETMTRMAEMCEKMMQMEMKGAGLKMAGFAALFILLIVNLGLLAVLQTQLIKHWHRRLQAPG